MIKGKTKEKYSFTINPDVHKEFQDCVAQNGAKMSSVLEILMESYIEHSKKENLNR